MGDPFRFLRPHFGPEQIVKACKDDKDVLMKPAGTVSEEISHLMREKGYPQKRAVAAALNMERAGKISKDEGEESEESDEDEDTEDEEVEKAGARGGKYLRRIPIAGKPGKYRYVYDHGQGGQQQSHSGTGITDWDGWAQHAGEMIGAHDVGRGSGHDPQGDNKNYHFDFGGMGSLTLEGDESSGFEVRAGQEEMWQTFKPSSMTAHGIQGALERAKKWLVGSGKGGPKLPSGYSISTSGGRHHVYGPGNAGTLGSFDSEREARHGAHMIEFKRLKRQGAGGSPAAQRARRAAEPSRKGVAVGDLAKAGGEGSRGGHIIGHTSSGKAIYAPSTEGVKPGEHRRARHQDAGHRHALRQSDNEGWTAQDHKDAAAIHRKMVIHHENEGDKHPPGSDARAHHRMMDAMHQGARAAHTRAVAISKLKPEIRPGQGGHKVGDTVMVGNSKGKVGRVREHDVWVDFPFGSSWVPRENVKPHTEKSRAEPESELKKVDPLDLVKARPGMATGSRIQVGSVTYLQAEHRDAPIEKSAPGLDPYHMRPDTKVVPDDTEVVIERVGPEGRLVRPVKKA